MVEHVQQHDTHAEALAQAGHRWSVNLKRRTAHNQAVHVLHERKRCAQYKLSLVVRQQAHTDVHTQLLLYSRGVCCGVVAEGQAVATRPAR